MGREALTLCRWLGKTAEVKALLESTELFLRGGLRAKIPRSAIANISARGGTLHLTANGETLQLDLGAEEAKKWAAALLKPPPSLATKLGVSAANKAFVIGPVDDAMLAAAIKGATTTILKDASILLAVLQSEADLKSAYKIARSTPGCSFWCVYGKGKFATISDGDIRAYLRAQGYVDNKTTAVSERLTATRYSRKAQT